MSRYRIWSIVLIIAAVLIGWFVYSTQKLDSRFAFKLGLDLAGGTELIYKADTSKLAQPDVKDAMETLKDVIERRVNLFGVSEPVVQVEGAGTFSADNKLIVDLPGVTDVQEAIRLIGQTPTLDFRIVQEVPASTTAAAQVSPSPSTTPTPTIPSLASLANGGSLSPQLTPSPSATPAPQTEIQYIPTGLTGRYLSKATVEFANQTNRPTVGLQFNTEGAELFAQITRENVGKQLAIFLDDQPISAPTIQGEISGGQAQITGNFTVQEASTLVRNLNYGALPVPISLVSTQTIGPSLGSSALNAGIYAGAIGFLVVAIFLVLWYRLPGFIATLALVVYVILSLAAFKLIGVTLTAAGLAGFILSIGMAVDANVLIFERMKEELKKGKQLEDSIHEGFHRAWLSIRDSNISSIITSLVLFWLGTSAVKGFALTLGLGVLVSMFTAITLSRTFLFAIARNSTSKTSQFLFGAGLGLTNKKS